MNTKILPIWSFIFILALSIISLHAAEYIDKDPATLDDLKVLCENAAIKSLELFAVPNNEEVNKLDPKPSGTWYYCSKSAGFFYSYLEIKNLYIQSENLLEGKKVSYNYLMCIHGKVDQPGNAILQDLASKKTQIQGGRAKIWSDKDNTTIVDAANRGYCDYTESLFVDGQGNANILKSLELSPGKYVVKYIIKTNKSGCPPTLLNNNDKNEAFEITVEAEAD
jgi:hypothetical protein